MKKSSKRIKKSTKEWWEKGYRIDSTIHREMAKICKFYGVKWRRLHNNAGGWSYTDEGRIEIGIPDSGFPIYQMLSVWFHELAHIRNHDLKKYQEYHRTCKTTPRVLKAVIKYGIKAEKYTDWVGEQLMHDWFPDCKYEKGYPDSYINEYRDEVIGHCREELANWRKN